MGLAANFTLQQTEISELEDKAIETIQNENQREKKTEKNKLRTCEMWNNFGQPNIPVIKFPEWEQNYLKKQQTKIF